MAPANTISNLSQLIQVFYEKKFLENLKKEMVFFDYAKKYTIPRGFGPSIYFHRYTKFAANTSALSEGTVPSAIALSSERVSATVAQYGDFVTYSDLLEAVHISGPNQFIEGAIEELAYRAKLSVDTLIRNALGAATGAVYKYVAAKASLAATIGSTDVALAADIRKIFRTLQAASAPKWDRDAYMGIIGPGQEYDLKSETNTGAWLDAAKYTSPEKMEKGEIGKLFGIRFVTSTNLSSLSQSGTINECYFFGKDAVGVVDITEVNKANRQMEHINIYIKEPGSAGTSDPLNQIGSVGYKFANASKRLDDSKVVIYRVGQTP